MAALTSHGDARSDERCDFAAMANATVLVSLLLAATGTNDFPSRIGTNASALGSVARARFEVNSNLLSLCENLEASEATGRYRGGGEGFNADDAQVIGFFLAGNTALREL